MTQNLEQKLNGFGISLHRAIVNQLIGEIEVAIADGRIRSQEGNHSVFDFIREILGKRSEHKVWERLVEGFPEVTLTFCQNKDFLVGARRRQTPTTDMLGCLYIAYISNSEYSHNLRVSSARLILADRTTPQPPELASQNVMLTPEAPTIEGLERSLEAAHTALRDFPYTIDKLWKVSGIVVKSQVKDAVIRDFVEGRDYLWADKLLCLNESTYLILAVSFRSLKGADISQLPEIIKLNTAAYFRFHSQKKNRRTAKTVDENQLNLFEPENW